MELLIARNPDSDSSLPYLLHVPLGADGLLFRTKGTWPRTSALYCHPVALSDWPARPEIVERIPLQGLRPPRCGDRRRRRPRPRAALPDRLHHGPRPRDGVLAVAA